MTDLQKRLLEMMKWLHSFIVKNGLKYYLFGGSMLGAVRHKGFIPWDDDIDIMMQYDDYDKLASIIRESNSGLNFIDISKNDDTIFPYGKICDTSTHITLESTFRLPKGYGAFVDVFPMTYYDDRLSVRKKQVNYCKWKRRIIEHSSRKKYVKSSSVLLNIKRIIGFLFGKFVNTRRVIKKLDKKLRSQPQSKWIGPIGFPFPIELFESGIVDLPFEGYNFMCPKSWDGFLKYQYGDYMKLPPIEERVAKHSIICERDEI